FLAAINKGYGFKGGSICLGAGMVDSEVCSGATVSVPLRTLNRHGLISGATGTGKTKTLSLIAEGLSESGVPVVLMDIKGDLSGIAAEGTADPRIQERHARIGVEWSPSGHPV